MGLRNYLKTGEWTPKESLYIEQLDEMLAKDADVLNGRIVNEEATRSAALAAAEEAKKKLEGHSKLLDRVKRLKDMR